MTERLALPSTFQTHFLLTDFDVRFKSIELYDSFFILATHHYYFIRYAFRLLTPFSMLFYGERAHENQIVEHQINSIVVMQHIKLHIYLCMYVCRYTHQISVILINHS